MATQTQTSTGPEQDQTVEKKIQQLRERYADAPELAKNGAGATLRELTSQVSQTRHRPWIAPAGSASVRARSRS